MTVYININRHIVAANKKHGKSDPPIRVTKGKHGKPVYGHNVKILGPCEILYDNEKPVLPCGARVAIATDSEVEIIFKGKGGRDGLLRQS